MDIFERNMSREMYDGDSEGLFVVTDTGNRIVIRGYCTPEEEWIVRTTCTNPHIKPVTICGSREDVDDAIYGLLVIHPEYIEDFIRAAGEYQIGQFKDKLMKALECLDS